MYLEADIKVKKMYRKGEMRRKKCKEREGERERERLGGSGMTETQTGKEEESIKEERNSNTVK